MHISQRACLVTGAIVLMAAIGGSPAFATGRYTYVKSVVIDDSTGGDWNHRYGSCFFLIPHERPPLQDPELPVGPDPYFGYKKIVWCGIHRHWIVVGDHKDQYEYTYTNPPSGERPECDDGGCVVEQCKGGRLLKEGLVNWRVFTQTEGGPRDNAFVYSLCEPGDIADGTCRQPDGFSVDPVASQFNPCARDGRYPFQQEHQNGTWDNDAESRGPLNVDLYVAKGGDAKVAFYFVEPTGTCRSTAWRLFIGGKQAKTWENGHWVPVEGRIGDFRQGKYLVFDIQNLPDGGTTIRLEGRNPWAEEQSPDCPALGGDLLAYGVNTHISSVFISGDICKRPKFCFTHWTDRPHTGWGCKFGDHPPSKFCYTHRTDRPHSGWGCKFHTNSPYKFCSTHRTDQPHSGWNCKYDDADDGAVKEARGTWIYIFGRWFLVASSTPAKVPE